MSRKYALIVSLVVVAALGVSAFSSVAYLPPVNTNVSIVNGSSLISAVSIASSSVPAAASMVVSPQYQYGPKSAATGFLAVARQYQYGPKSAITGFLAP